MKKTSTLVFCVALSVACASMSSIAGAQSSDALRAADQLPSAPQPQVAKGAIKLPVGNTTVLVADLQGGNASQMSNQPAPKPGQKVPNPSGTLHLTRREAEQIALKNNPRISVGRLLALAQHQIYRQTRSDELPTFTGTVTAVDANEGSRIGAGGLNAPRLLEHAGAGVTLSQLLTDFGRTVNLVSSAKLQEKAQNANALATTEDIILATDQAFYNALEAQALMQVAQQTVSTRQSVEQQVDQLAKSNLKSTLDLSFAQVNLSQAKLLQLDAQNNVDSTIATLTAILGFDKQVTYDLTEENKEVPPPPPDVDVLTNTALQQRPDLQASNYNQQAAEKFRKAERDLLFPTVSALGMAGGTPVRPDCFGGCFPNYFTSSWYGAIGMNVSIPIFNGFLYTARASEAKYRARAAVEDTRDLHDRVVRDVRTAWLGANTAFQRVGVEQQLAQQADLALRLAKERYQLGLGSIVELSQAQLQQTDAAIGYVNSQYRYRLALSTLNFEIGAQP